MKRICEQFTFLETLKRLLKCRFLQQFQPIGGFVEATCFATVRLYWNKMECNYAKDLESVMFYCDIG